MLVFLAAAAPGPCQGVVRLACPVQHLRLQFLTTDGAAKVEFRSLSLPTSGSELGECRC